MLVHLVRFYLRPDLANERRAALRAGLESLRTIPTVRQLLVGTPAPVPSRPVIDNEYGFALTVLFDDLAGHDTYQSHPTHLKFVADHKDCWTRVAVVDAA
ncbi:MAG TPA: Dabb family protein [Opitutaceae bacterium]|nr:Dabb family protein [Opitutaceae bacterium]